MPPWRPRSPSAAAAVLVSSAGWDPHAGKPLLLVPQPRLAFAQAAVLASWRAALSVYPRYGCGCSRAQLAGDVSIGPHAVIEEGARIGTGTTSAAER